MNILTEKTNPFKVPEGYFEILPDKIMRRVDQKKPNFPWMKWAAAAFVIISLGLYQFLSLHNQDELIALDEEIELYIDSNYWTAEDILGMADNPEEILNQIIQEELPYMETLWETEENNIVNL